MVGKKTDQATTNFRVQEKKTAHGSRPDVSTSKLDLRNNENMSIEGATSGSKKNLMVNIPKKKKNVTKIKLD